MNASAAAARIVLRALRAPPAVRAAHFLLNALDGHTRIPEVDAPMHFAGGPAVARLIARTLDVGAEAGVVRLRPALLDPLLIVACTALAAALRELHEPALDTLVRARQPGGLTDAMTDLFFGLLGGTCYAGVRWRPHRTGEGR